MAAVSTPSGDFAIMVREVTMEQYDECVAKSTCPNAGKQKGCNWQVEGMEQRPINCVNWQAAVAYCAGHGWRLPTDEEWESAAEQLPSLGATVREWISSDAASGGKVARANRRSKTVRTTESPADLKADLGFRCAVSL
jgi:formylglycine-generating enzyme required for sulfatase activity